MKIGFLITARLKSTRLPFKILKDLNGKTVIERIIDRAKEVGGISEIVICTSTNAQDRALVDIAKTNSIYYFNGDEEDVLKRLLDAATFYGMDSFISITADNPLFSIYHANLVFEKLQTGKCEFVKIEGLPLGCAVYGVGVKALKVVWKIKPIFNTEIWGYLIDRPEVFTVESLKADGRFNKPELRLTLDYPEDYELISKIYSSVVLDRVLDLLDVIDYLEGNPQLAHINKNCIQLDLDERIKEEINKNYKENVEKIKKIKEEINPTIGK